VEFLARIFELLLEWYLDNVAGSPTMVRRPFDGRETDAKRTPLDDR
jgi:hypothetical protein